MPFFAVSLSMGALALTTTYYYRVLFNCTVRSGAGTNYSSLGTAGIGSNQHGYYPSTTYTYSKSQWEKIHWNGGAGYIRNDLVCPDTFIYTVNTSSLTVRSSPGISNSAVCSVGSGIKLERMDDSAVTTGTDTYTWIHVRVRTGVNEAKTGYVAAEYLSYGY